MTDSDSDPNADSGGGLLPRYAASMTRAILSDVIKVDFIPPTVSGLVAPLGMMAAPGCTRDLDLGSPRRPRRKSYSSRSSAITSRA